MKIALPAAFVALLALASSPTLAVTLAPGQSANANGVGSGASDTLPPLTIRSPQSLAASRTPHAVVAPIIPNNFSVFLNHAAIPSNV